MSSKTKTTLALAVSIVCMMLLVGILSTINPAVFNLGGADQDQKPSLTNPLFAAYDYPVEKLKAADGVIPNYFLRDDDPDNDGDAHKYIVDEENKVAFIDLTDCVFTKVTLSSSKDADGNRYMAFAFLSKMPELGEEVSYAIGYNELRQSTSDSIMVPIPADAVCLVIYYQDKGPDVEQVIYAPRAIQFTGNKYLY